MAKCGRCGATVEVLGAGRFQCPVCGTTNQIPGALDPEPPSGIETADAPAPRDEAPSPRTRCPACSFEFIVGDIDSAVCPNCREEVSLK